jgi:putative membrane-bound dehydrogenase-like protein
MNAKPLSYHVAALLVIVAASFAGSSNDQAIPAPDSTLTVPAGFSIERVAGPPLVNRPIVADFDEQGRLYVADSSGSNDKVDKQLADKPHRIVRLEDSDRDGRFDKSVVFADKMMFPEGAMWFDGSLYVAAPPSIWRLTDTNGDGVADEREEWFQGKTLTGCANDLHGPYLGPDGWIYWTKGAFAEQTYERPGKPPLVTRASHILRRKPGDPAVDIVMTGGMDNPVDVAFTATGERLLTATFVEHPQLGRRDGLIHAIYGGLYGKPHAVVEGHKRTGDLMPVLAELGPAVPAGLTRYPSTAFGDDYRDNFFAAMFNLRKVTRQVLEPAGATFTARESDFVVSQNRDFHPTDVIADADGSLLVIDTGPWYKLCCPTSQLAKPDVLGGIYRVRRVAAPAPRDPRGLELTWTAAAPGDLAARLGDERPAVQTRAVSALGRMGVNALDALERALRAPASADARRNAVWALTRIDGAKARESIRRAMRDDDVHVRHAAIHASGLWRDRDAVAPLREALMSGPAPIQRAAAEALGRIGDASAVPDLLALAASPLDRVLEHSVTYALIEINNPASITAASPQATAPRSRRAALIALDQMDASPLAPADVVSLLDSTDPVLKDTAWWVVGHHPDWGNALAVFFESHLPTNSLSATARDELQQKLVQFGDNPAIQELLARSVVSAKSAGAQVSALQAMASIARTRVKSIPQSWIAPLLSVLSSRDPAVLSHAIAVVRGVPAPKDVPDVRTALLGVARNSAVPPDTRLDALVALREGLAVVEPDLFELVRRSLRADRPASIKSAATTVVEKATFDSTQLVALATSLQSAGPLELPRLLHAFRNGGDERVGLAMIDGLSRSTSRSSVRADTLRPLLAKYPEPVQTRGQALLASLSADADAQVRRLEGLLPAVAGGDVSRGQAVFNSQKGACYSCHAIGYMGGRIGPDLTRIGQVRSERDLLEAIIFPSASFARGYEPVVIKTRSGEVRGGVLRSNDLPDEVVLATDRDEVRIPRRDIVDMQPGTVSLMPQGFAEQLTREELADLLAFLKATRSGAD